MYVCVYESPIKGASHNPYREGTSNTHMPISVFFPTDIGVLHKAPIEIELSKVSRGFTKPLERRGLQSFAAPVGTA